MSSKNFQIDISARFFAFCRSFERDALHLLLTLWYRFKLRLQGVVLGDKVSFNGPIHVERFKYSVIRIGNGCIFNGMSLFNYRGIGHCILQTGTDHAQIVIGDNCGFSGVSIVSNESVTIGNNVTVGANVKIGDTDDHPEIFGTNDSPICIGNGVFIGMNSVILKGVTVGENTIIGAGSVVTKDLPCGVVAAGNPCKVIKQR